MSSVSSCFYPRQPNLFVSLDTLLSCSFFFLFSHLSFLLFYVSLPTLDLLFPSVLSIFSRLMFGSYTLVCLDLYICRALHIQKDST